MNAQRTSDTLVPYILLAGVCAFLPFVSAIRWGFLNWDDTRLVLENPAIRSLGVASIWDWLTSVSEDTYRPVVLFTFALEFALGGADPAVFHGTNLILHAVNTVLIGMLLSSMFKDRIVVMFALLFFAVHPLRVEPVAWISARHDLLSTLFLLTSILFFLRYRTDKRDIYRLASLTAAVLASLSSPMAVVLPVLILILQYALPGAMRARDRRVLVPYWALATGTGIMAIVTQYATHGFIFPAGYSLTRAMTLPFWNVVFSVRRSLAPYSLSAVYPYPESGGPDLLLPSIISLILLSIVAIALMVRKPEKRAGAGIGWFLVCLTPVLQIIPTGTSFTADRYMYLPAIGLSIVLGVAIERIIGHKKGMYRPLVRRVGILLLAVFGTISYIRTDVWEKSLTLWTDVLETYPSYAEGYLYLGSAMASEEQDLPNAVAAFTESLRLDGKNPQAYRNRALARYQSGSSEAADIISDLTAAITLDPENIDHQLLLAEVYLANEEHELAFQMCSALLDAEPGDHRARLLRVRAAFALGHAAIVDEDIRVLDQAGIEISIEPDTKSDAQRF